MGSIKARPLKLANIVSAYIELPVGVTTIGDKKYTVEEVDAGWMQEDGTPARVNSIVLIEPVTAETTAAQ